MPSTNYTELSAQLSEQFLASFDVEAARLRQARARELNCPAVVLNEMLTPKLNIDQEAVVVLVAELASADEKRARQIKYQLKHYFHFDLKSRTFTR